MDGLPSLTVFVETPTPEGVVAALVAAGGTVSPTAAAARVRRRSGRFATEPIPHAHDPARYCQFVTVTFMQV